MQQNTTYSIISHTINNIHLFSVTSHYILYLTQHIVVASCKKAINHYSKVNLSIYSIYATIEVYKTPEYIRKVQITKQGAIAADPVQSPKLCTITQSNKLVFTPIFRYYRIGAKNALFLHSETIANITIL